MLVWSDGRQVTIRRNMIFEVQWRGFPVPLPFRPISEKSNDVTSVVFALAFRPRPPVAIGDTAFPRTDGRSEGFTKKIGKLFHDVAFLCRRSPHSSAERELKAAVHTGYDVVIR